MELWVIKLFNTFNKYTIDNENVFMEQTFFFSNKNTIDCRTMTNFFDVYYYIEHEI